jgi:uncharacterized coiled-coil DUF342 family protein
MKKLKMKIKKLKKKIKKLKKKMITKVLIPKMIDQLIKNIFGILKLCRKYKLMKLLAVNST